MSAPDKTLLGPLDAGMVRQWEQDFRRHILSQHARPPNQIPAVASQDVVDDGLRLLHTSVPDAVQRWMKSSHARFVQWISLQRLGTVVLDYRITLENYSVRMAMRAVQLFTSRWRNSSGRELISVGTAEVSSNSPIFTGARLVVMVDPETGRMYAFPEDQHRQLFVEVS